MTTKITNPPYLESPVKPVEPMKMCVNMTYDPGPITPAPRRARPAMMCVSTIYDPGPITQGERLAVRTFIDSVGGLERAQKVLRELGKPSGG